MSLNRQFLIDPWTVNEKRNIGAITPELFFQIYFRNNLTNARLEGSKFPVALDDIVYFYLFYLASPQEQGHHNSVSQLLWARIT